MLSFVLCFPACGKIAQLNEKYIEGHPSADMQLADVEQSEVDLTGDGLTEDYLTEDHLTEEPLRGHEEHPDGSEEHKAHKIIVTSPIRDDVRLTRQYVCQIHAWRQIEVCALEGGYLESIDVKEGQLVKKGQRLFKILPILYRAKLAADEAHADLMRIKRDNAQRLFEQNIVAKPEVDLANAELAKAEAEVSLAQAEMDFADIKAPFGGIVDRQHAQLGSLIDEGDVLTTLSDNSQLWVYFNVPERDYLEYEASTYKDELTVELKLANHEMFSEEGKIGAIEAEFNHETGNISFRADFENPDRLLRHGQTGKIMLSHIVKDAMVIPQRATYEILAKKYAYVVDRDNVIHQRDITVEREMEDIYVISDGLDVSDKIIFEGVRQVRPGESVEYEYKAPEDILENLKHHAE